MQLLFRVSRLVSCRHQLDEKFHDKARWFSAAARRIGPVTDPNGLAVFDLIRGHRPS
jgi:hypothetical protein